jgi:type IV pilus assembly protein PilX
MNTNRPGPDLERGVALIVGLVILAILSLIGVAAFSVSTQEERMAGNSRDRMRAFEAAEAALRNCETFVSSGAALFNGTDGTYPALLSSASQPITETAAARLESFWQTPAPGAVVQLLDTNGTAYNGNSFPPSCLAEPFSVPNAFWTPGTPLNSSNSVTIAHITAHGYGLNRNTVVRLESYFAL